MRYDYASSAVISPDRVRTLVLERIESRYGMEVRRDVAGRLDARELGCIADAIVLELRSSQLGRRVDSGTEPETVTEGPTRYTPVPASWWDHLKQTVRDRFCAWMDRHLPPYHKPVALRDDVRRISFKTRDVPSAVSVHKHTTVKNRYHVCPHLDGQHTDHIRFLDVPSGDGVDEQIVAEAKALAKMAVEAFRADPSIEAYFYRGDSHRRFVAAMRELDDLLSRR